jgi:hypothetical protein
MVQRLCCLIPKSISGLYQQWGTTRMSAMDIIKGWVRDKIGASAPSASQPSHTLPTGGPDPTTTAQSAKPGAVPHQLPSTLAEIPDQHEDESTASVWAQIFCGSGRVRTQRVPTADQLEPKRLQGANTSVLQHVYGEPRLKPPINVPKAPVDWSKMAGV